MERRKVPPKLRGLTATDQRKNLNSRMQETSVRIRKERKEEKLKLRRRHGAGDAAALMSCLKAYVQHPEKESLRAFRQALASGASEAFLLTMVEKDTASAENVVSLLQAQVKHQPLDSEDRDLALSVLFDLTSLTYVFKPEHEYYGNQSVRWSDLIAEDSTFISYLVSLLPVDAVVDIVTNIIGNLAHDSTRVLADFRSYHFTSLVSFLPKTAYACAAIIKQDSVSDAMDFLSSLTNSHLVGLFEREETAISAAWCLEGLTRREDSAVEHLCIDKTLMNTLIQRLEEATLTSRPFFLVPALQAITNMASACDGEFVADFLSSDIFVKTLATLIQKGIVVDCLTTAASLLCDAGINDHPSTTIGGPAFLPGLVLIVTSPLATYEWKSLATNAILQTLKEPPGSDPEEVHSALLGLLKRHIWDCKERDLFIQALLDQTKLQDMGAVVVSLRILDRIVRNIPSTRTHLESFAIVDRLEEVCTRAVGQYSSDYEFASSIAADLLDDVFCVEDGDDPDEEDQFVAPAVVGGQFAFGVAPPVAPFHFEGRGRGRGRTQPAWMNNSN
jgi:hypothetical protein